MESCWNQFGVDWCICLYLFAAVSFSIFSFTIFQIVYYVRHTEKTIKRHLLVLCVTSAQCLVMTTHYLIVGDDYNILYMLMEYMQFVFYTSICYYFSFQVYSLVGHLSRIDKLGSCLLGCNLLYLSGCALYFIIEQFNDKDIYSCRTGLWLFMRSNSFVLTSVFIMIGIRTRKQLRVVSTTSIFITNLGKEKQLWWNLIRYLLIIIFTSSTASFFNNIYYFINTKPNCNEYFGGNESLNIFLFAMTRVISHYLPISACLYVFWNTMRPTPIDKRDNLMESFESSARDLYESIAQSRLRFSSVISKDSFL